MKKKLTRKQAERILAKRFNKSTYNTERIRPLCASMPNKLRGDWDNYWTQINTRRCHIMPRYLKNGGNDQEVTFLRLLTAHLFIRHVYGEE
jgi:hypothetical protein